MCVCMYVCVSILWLCNCYMLLFLRSGIKLQKSYKVCVCEMTMCVFVCLLVSVKRCECMCVCTNDDCVILLSYYVWVWNPIIISAIFFSSKITQSSLSIVIKTLLGRKCIKKIQPRIKPICLHWSSPFISSCFLCCSCFYCLCFFCYFWGYYVHSNL